MTEARTTTHATTDETTNVDAPGVQRLVGIGPGHVLLVSLAVATFSVLWFGSYQLLDSFIWDSEFVSANRWTIPVGVLFFSLLVWLAQKYLNAPDAIEGEALDPVVSGETTVYRRFFGTLTSSYASLLSGASIGPEGPLGYLAVDVSGWLVTRLKLSEAGFLPAAMSGMSAAYNGIIGNSIFTAVMSTETSGGKGGLPVLATNIAAGVVGFLVFTIAGVPPFAGSMAEGEPFELTVKLVLWATGLGLVGSLIAFYIGAAMAGAQRLMGFFDERGIPRVMVAGIVIAVVCYFFPVLLFAGEAPLEALAENPAQSTVMMLLLLAVAKPLLLALSLKGGYLGGAIFPCLFSAVMVGLALSQILPGVPVGVLTACVEVGVLTLVLGAPLTSILLVALLTAADANLLELIAVAAVTAMIAGQLVKGLASSRAATRYGGA